MASRRFTGCAAKLVKFPSDDNEKEFKDAAIELKNEIEAVFNAN